MPEPQTIHCPRCNKAYPWKVELAGKRVQCKCGQKFRIPTLPSGEVEAIGSPPPPVEENAGYALSDDEPAAPPAPKPVAAGGDGRCPSCGHKISPDAVICMNCGYNLASGARVETQVIRGDSAPAAPPPQAAASDAPANPFHSVGGTSAVAAALDAREDEYVPSKLKTTYLPIILYVFGLLILPASSYAAAVYGFEDGSLQTIGIVFASQLVMGVFTVGILFAAFLLASRLVGLEFGDLRVGLYKLGSIAVGTSLLADVLCIIFAPAALAFGVQGVTAVVGVVFLVNMILVGVPMGAMFDLDFQDVGITTSCVIICKIGLGTVGLTMASMFA